MAEFPDDRGIFRSDINRLEQSGPQPVEPAKTHFFTSLFKRSRSESSGGKAPLVVKKHDDGKEGRIRQFFNRLLGIQKNAPIRSPEVDREKLGHLATIRHDPLIDDEEKLALFANSLEDATPAETKTIEAYTLGVSNFAKHKRDMGALRNQLATHGYASTAEFDISKAHLLKEFLDNIPQDQWNPEEVRVAKEDLAFIGRLLQTEDRIVSWTSMAHLLKTNLEIYGRSSTEQFDPARMVEGMSAQLRKTSSASDPEFEAELMNGLAFLQSLVVREGSIFLPEDISDEIEMMKVEMDTIKGSVESSMAERPQTVPQYDPAEPLESKLRALKPDPSEISKIKAEIAQIDNALKRLSDGFSPAALNWPERTSLQQLKNRLEEEKELKQKPLQKAHSNLEALLLSNPPDAAFADLADKFTQSLARKDYQNCETIIDDFVRKVFEIPADGYIENDLRMSIRQVLLSYLIEQNDPAVESIVEMEDIPEFGFIGSMQSQLMADRQLVENISALVDLQPGEKLVRRREEFTAAPMTPAELQSPGSSTRLEYAKTLLFLVQRMHERTSYRLTPEVSAEIKKALDLLEGPAADQPLWIREGLNLTSLKQVREIEQKCREMRRNL